MKVLTKHNGTFIVQDVDTKTVNGFVRAIQKPSLVTTKLITITTASEYSAFLQSFKTVVRPFAVCVMTQNPEGK